MEDKILQDIVRFRRTMMRISKRMLWRFKLMRVYPATDGWYIEIFSSKQYAESTGRNRENRRLVRERDVVRQVTSLARQHRIPVLNVLLPGEEEDGVITQTAE